MINITTMANDGRVRVETKYSGDTQILNYEGLDLLVALAGFIQKELPLLWFGIKNMTFAELYRGSMKFEEVKHD